MLKILCGTRFPTALRRTRRKTGSRRETLASRFSPIAPSGPPWEYFYSVPRYTAPRIHDGFQFLPEGSTVVLDDTGTVVEIGGPETAATADVTLERGILCPGFINAHCHLELSHLKGAVPEGTGLMVFLQQVIKLRAVPEETRRERRQAAFDALQAAGVVAVGDIANTADTLDLRASDRMHVHTFVEALGFIPQTAPARFEATRIVWQQFTQQPAGRHYLAQTVTPHAPYTVSPELFRCIDAHAPEARLSIHNGESPDENDFYRDGTGGVPALLDSLGFDFSFYAPYGADALPTYGGWLGPDHPVLFVHNTVTTPEEIHWAEQRFREAWWCLCPGANRYIEGRLPDVPMLARETDALCIGTDSLASNHQLSVLAELQLLKTFYPTLSWEDLLRWGTSNGARALGMADRVGALEAGRRPGLLHIEDLLLGTPVRLA